MSSVDREAFVRALTEFQWAVRASCEAYVSHSLSARDETEKAEYEQRYAVERLYDTKPTTPAASDDDHEYAVEPMRRPSAPAAWTEEELADMVEAEADVCGHGVKREFCVNVARHVLSRPAPAVETCPRPHHLLRAGEACPTCKSRPAASGGGSL